jgi:hypothetical protein
MTADPRVNAVGEIRTAHLFDIVVDLDPRLTFGAGPYGNRVLFGSAGGSFDGPRLRGEVLPGGGDWALFRPDGAMALDVRLALRTHDGALVHVVRRGPLDHPTRAACRHRRPRAPPPSRPGPLLLPHHPAVRDGVRGLCLAE